MNLSVCMLQKFLKTLNETILTHKKVNGGAQIGFQVLQNSFMINCFSLMTHNHASWRTDNLSRNNLARKQHNAHVKLYVQRYIPYWQYSLNSSQFYQVPLLCSACFVQLQLLPSITPYCIVIISLSPQILHIVITAFASSRSCQLPMTNPVYVYPFSHALWMLQQNLSLLLHHWFSSPF